MTVLLAYAGHQAHQACSIIRHAAGKPISIRQQQLAMRYTYMLVLPLLLALPQLAVGSSYSTQAAETRQDQQRQQCQKLALNSYAAGIDSRLGNGSCPAQLQPFPAEAPAVAAPTFGIGAAAAINSTHRITAQQVNNSSTAGSRHVSSDEAAEQQCAGEQGCSWQTFIVRFSQYKMLSEHKQALGGVSCFAARMVWPADLL
jgi:hypothetical protein